MNIVQSILFTALFYFSTYILLFLTLPVLLLPRKKFNFMPFYWCKLISWFSRITIGIKEEVIGLENLPKSPFLIVSKHQSAWETLAFNYLFPKSVFVLKKELLRIPFFGLYLIHAGMIPLDRKTARGLKNMLRVAKDRIKEGRNVVIFPEGTRTAPGSKNTYKKGVYLLYRTLNVPVVPIALNSGVFWPRNTVIKYPGTIKAEILKSIEPGLDEKTFMKKIETEIEEASNRLYMEAVS
jgi:1-acyl-sn-glycerol-3-phosphate acyltransferase